MVTTSHTDESERDGAVCWTVTSERHRTSLRWVLDAAPISIEDLERQSDMVVVALDYSRRIALLAFVVECALALNRPITIHVECVRDDVHLAEAASRWAALLVGSETRVRVREGWMDLAEMEEAQNQRGRDVYTSPLERSAKGPGGHGVDSAFSSSADASKADADARAISTAQEVGRIPWWRRFLPS